MPEIVFESEDSVPEPFRPIAEAKDGKFVIDVAPSKELKEFRERNIELSKARDAQDSFMGRLKADLNFDPEKYDDFVSSYEELRNVKQQVDDGKLVADTSLDKAVEERTREMKKEHENLVNSLKTTNHALTEENRTTKSKLARAQVDKEFFAAINNPKSGALPEATDTILMYAYDTWRPNDEGNLIGYDRENKVIYGSDGATPMTPMEWLAKLRDEKPYLFKQSEGGGGGGHKSGTGLSAADLMKLSPVERMNLARQNTQ